MKVLLLNVNAISGSTGKIVTDIKNVLETNGHECLICYGANETVRKPRYKRVCSEFERRVNAAISRITGILHGKFLPFSFYRFKKVIKHWKPDVVHIHCPNGYIIDLFKTLNYLAENRIKTVVTNHAEFFYTGGCGHAFDCKKWLTGCSDCSILKSKVGLDVSNIEWTKFKNAFDKFNKDNTIITSVSPWVANRSRKSLSLKRFNNEVVLNGLDTDIFRNREISDGVKSKLPNGKPILLHVTASFSLDKDSIKGGIFIAELAKLMPEFNFVVACSYNHSKEVLPENLLIWGRTKNQEELAELYNAADVTVLTSKRETFSMVVAESLCCGTPVVGFKAGGPESIGLPEYSQFVDYGNILELKTQIKNMISKKYCSQEISRQSTEAYSKEMMSNRYMGLYNLLYSINE